MPGSVRRTPVYDRFRYNIVRVWERPVDEILAAGLPVLPLAPVSNVAKEELAPVLVAISERLIRETTREQAAILWAATKVMMGLKYPKTAPKRIHLIFSRRAVAIRFSNLGNSRSGSRSGSCEGVSAGSPASRARSR